MEFRVTAIPDVILIEPDVLGDARGFFVETWNEAKFNAGGINARFVQDNLSRSRRHILRGLHYQIGNAQGKLVRVAAGAVFDVAVDIRRSSPTFGKWVGAELSEQNKQMMWIPPGFAHGFVVLSESADFAYKCTELYSPANERAIAWNDPAIGIDWHLPEGVQPQLSAKDSNASLLASSDTFP
jgi:dTDP-4-dehydrorhamnose 3,5-epimerase